eukprot:TRINITY_DN12547_c0_g1_i2.p2 TRINITY_DN12547_c0_g1~~TRINITY_DN12547_c0_g1_i2.p2  ORF type:complete len:106 (+),score=21.62 TRINITY_DN12547_c0_g1_i2:389-706(+)
MLRSLSGRRHTVVTGLVVIAGGARHEEVVTTTVHFDELSDATIEAYVASGEPMDKAGGYGIQGLAGSLVRGIEGDYYNAVGFPLNRFCAAVRRLVSDGHIKLPAS